MAPSGAGCIGISLPSPKQKKNKNIKKKYGGRQCIDDTISTSKGAFFRRAEVKNTTNIQQSTRPIPQCRCYDLSDITNRVARKAETLARSFFCGGV